MCEVIFLLAHIAIHRRDPEITLGKCQVGIQFWRKRYPNTFKLLAALHDDVANYNVCCDFLATKAARNIKEILIAYNGRPTHAYAVRFGRNLSSIGKVVDAARLNRINSLQ
jgi:hypothetical protein